MELNEYQRRAMTTCMASSENFSYMFINLVGEVGEIASKVAKGIRKEMFAIDQNDLKSSPALPVSLEANEMAEIRKEIGDVLWQLSGLASVLGLSLEDVAVENLDKLASRKQRNLIDGSGDNR